MVQPSAANGWNFRYGILPWKGTSAWFSCSHLVSGAYLGQKSHLQELPRFELSHAQMGSIIFLQRKVVGMTCKRWWQLTYFWNFHPYLWKIPILTHIFLMGWLHHQLAFIILGLPFKNCKESGFLDSPQILRQATLLLIFFLMTDN